MKGVPGSMEHGTHSCYAHGCRCNDCGLAQLRWQREYRASKAPLGRRLTKGRPSKYAEPSTPQSTIDLWKARLG